MASSSRYNSFDSQTSAPSSSSEFIRRNTNSSGSKALTRTKYSDPVSLVKKFITEKRSSKPKGAALFIPPDFIAQDLKKTQKPASNFSSFPRKLFCSDKDSKKKKASPLSLPLTEVKSNTRTLAMLLRSERELLNQNKDYEAQIAELKLMLEDKTTQVDKLKDLCLKQREEIQHLKNAILFPDLLLVNQPQQPKHDIPTLQRQVTSLTDQLQCLADDLAQVKADKFATRAFFEGQVSSPLISVLDQEATNSLEFSSDNGTAPGSPDDIFFQDFNPCLTPYSTKSKSKEFDEIRGYSSPEAVGLLGSKLKGWGENHPHGRKLSKSSECCKRPSIATRTFPLSSENKSEPAKLTLHS